MRITDGAPFLAEIAELEHSCFGDGWSEASLRTGLESGSCLVALARGRSCPAGAEDAHADWTPLRGRPPFFWRPGTVSRAAGAEKRAAESRMEDEESAGMAASFCMAPEPVRPAGAGDRPSGERIDFVCAIDALTPERRAAECGVPSEAAAGELIGYAFFLESIDCELLRIAVRPAWRRRGVAERLLRERLVRGGFERMLLEVRAGNMAARRLYEKLGFAVDGVRKNYYKTPTEDAILMSLTASAEAECDRDGVF